jgi:hypothetical protein
MSKQIRLVLDTLYFEELDTYLYWCVLEFDCISSTIAIIIC